MWLAATGGSATGASSSTVVSATVPSAVTLTNNCAAPAAYRLGTILPGSFRLSAIGADVCSIGFQSSNDTALLRMGQADGIGDAMTTGMTWNPAVDGSSVRDIVSPSTGVAWMVADHGVVRRTTDGGATWESRPIPVYGTSGAIAALDADRAWVKHNSGKVYRTTDGGVTWIASTSSPYPSGSRPNGDIDAVSATVIFLVDDDQVHRSTDGGDTWTMLGDFGVYPGLSGVDGIDANTVWAVGTAGTWRTGDAGATWTSSGVTGTRSVSASSATTAVAVGDGGRVLRSTDSGASFAAQTSPTTVSLRSVSRFDASTLYAAGADGVVMQSTDNGMSWTLVPTPSTALHYSVAATVGTATEAWIAGTGGLVHRTTDSGAGWTVRSSTAGDLHGVAAFSSQRAVVVGDRGTTRYTTNGSAWTTVQAPGAQTLRSVTMPTRDHVLAVGDGGVIIRSLDGGATWSIRSSGITTRLTDVHAVDAQVAWAVGLGGVLLRSGDGGSTWALRDPGTSVDLHAVTAADRDVVWVSGEGGVLRRSADGGTSFSAQSSGVTSRVHSLDAISTTEAYAAAGDRLLRTVDGTTWTNTAAPVGFGGLSASGGGWVFGVAHRFAVWSFDGGSTWNINYCAAQCHGNSGHVWNYAVDVVDHGHMFAVGESGNLTRTTAPRSIPDYAAANDWSTGSSTAAFGVCLQDVNAATTPLWTRDADATCTASTTDPWRDVPDDLTNVARTTTSGAAGRADVVWGMRVGLGTPAGTYRATVTFEALAPGV